MPAKLSTRPTLWRGAAVTCAVGLAVVGTGLPTGRPSESAVSRFYDQKVAWGKCPGEGMPKDMQCGKVTVPLDYGHPRDGTLELALARYRATGDRKGSVLVNFGGPGGAGVPEFAGAGKEFMSLTDDYDIVTFDPRGVGRSSPVSCGDGKEQIDLPDDPAEVRRDPRAVLDGLREAAAACARHSGPVLPHIGTVDASRDLDVMRAALGDKKLNYLGFSYGTRLGAVYAAQFPDKVGRLVLDGVDTLTEPLTEQGVAGAEGQQKALDEFTDWCAEDVACPFGQDARQARRYVVMLVDSLDKDPVPSVFGEPFTGQDLVAAISSALYSKELWPTLERALATLVEDGSTHAIEAFAGGGGSPVRRAKAGDRDGGLVDAEDVPLDNPAAAMMAINCADDPDRPTGRQIVGGLDRLRARYEEASPVFGRQRLTEVLMCYGRPAGTDFIREDVKDLDTPKVLLVGTRGDPATPYRWTMETARRLGSAAVVLDNKGSGHTGYASSKCVHGTVDAFLLYGTLPPDGSSCAPDEDRR
ncbi:MULTISPECIES: alpha/beta hydrolase [unclassified Streptomyces]|uniref:alpha/beta hydrolase n=1 Tax=unclassified Streptomyces TaxID=2593676 RepID=UPI00074AFC0C|nr:MULTISPECIES: alpha/beta hydrolase [unclassified Streptomyces]KUL73644.1 protease [Streptomyces sp. NRRL WC-3604]KUL79723.1 protease [Streptomyces sp. NRRL WC-3605]